MKKIMVLFSIIVFTLFFSSVNAECPPDKQAIIKPGVYGAVNTDKYKEMETALKDKNQDKLQTLIKEKSVSEIPSGKKVCILDISFYGYCKKVEVPGMEIPYWVGDDTIIEVK